MRKTHDRLYFDEPANAELNLLLGELAQLGVPQNEVAKQLGISPTQLSRVKGGERRATQLQLKSLRKLRAERRDCVKKGDIQRLPIFSLSRDILLRLSPQAAIGAFRDLLWAEARRRNTPVTKIWIPDEIFTADGGIDASILGDGSSSHVDEFFSPGTGFQVKTGNAEPWKLHWARRELFRGKEPGRANLGAGVRRCLEENGRYTLVCFGIELLVEQRRSARDNLLRLFEDCGYRGANVEVLGQTQLIGLFQAFPSLCLKLRGHDQDGFRFHESWSRDNDMRGTLRLGPEQEGLVEEIRGHLRSGDVGHVRLIGEPGVGKTRLALEATRKDDLAPVVLYISDGAKFNRSSFINELVQADDSRFVVLIVDECLPKDRAEIWNTLKHRCDKTRLLTIGHGPDSVSGDGMKVINVLGSSKEQIVAIIADYGIPTHDADRWATFCEGSPRVAHVIGENLQRSGADLLQTPDTVQIWDRFIIGHDNPASEEVELRKVVLRHLSLFERFGFESPVELEAKFIADLAARCDSRLTWQKFQSIVYDLKQRRIVQGATTLYVTPSLLRVYLYTEYWERHGRAIDLAQMLQSMPRQLWHWFVEMLCFAHLSPVAEDAVDKLLGPHGLFPGQEFPDVDANGRLVMVLAEANPKATLRCLQRTIGKSDVSQLQKLKTARQSIVWGLERIAARTEHFSDAAALLLILAEAENANCVNNATGTFRELFSLIPGMGATQASPAQRLLVLKNALESASAKHRDIALLACESALSTHGGFRIIGPEHQGLRRTIQFWAPKTYGELWDAYRDVWELLVSKLASWQLEERQRLISTLIKCAWSTLHIRPLAWRVLETLESIENDPFTDVKALVEFIDRQLRHREGNLSDETAQRLQSLRGRLDGSNFGTKLRRFVKHVTFEDTYDGTKQTGIVEQRLHELAQESFVSPELLRNELPWLVCEQSYAASAFGFQLGQLDSERNWLEELLTQQAAQSDCSTTLFLGGYLRSIYERDPSEWETRMLKLAAFPAVADRYADFVLSSGMSEATVRKVLQLCQDKVLDPKCLERWWFSSGLRQLSEETFYNVITLQLSDEEGRLWSNAVHMCHTYYLEKDHERQLPEQFTFELLTHPSIGDDRQSQAAGYYWSRLSKAFLDSYPDRKWAFFGKMLRVGTKHWSVLQDLDMNEEQVLTSIVKSDPSGALDHIADVYRGEEHREMFGIAHWLGDGGRGFDDLPGPIQFLPQAKLFAWIDGDVDDRGYWFARMLPKTLDKTPCGRLTRDFIARYGTDESIASAVWARFHSRGWCGSASDHYRSLRDEARTWLIDETSSTVRHWIENYIDSLSYDIERSEIEEERRL
jgi:hypothetical protein